MKIFAAIFTVLFILFALVQLNDPDPWLWTTVYALSAAASAAAFTGRYPLLLLMIAAISALVFAIVLFPTDAGGWIEAEQANRSVAMKLPWVEEARESLGLMLCSSVLTTYFVYGLRSNRRAHTAD